MPIPDTFGKRLQQAREAQGLSVLGLADRSGLSPKTIERWESGETKAPPIDLAARAAIALGASLDELAGVVGAVA